MNLRRLPAPSALTATRTWSRADDRRAGGVTIGVLNRGRVPIRVTVQRLLPPIVPARSRVVELTSRPGGSAAGKLRDARRASAATPTMGGVALQWRDAWGLVERWGIAPLDQTVRVYPNLQEGRRQAMFLIRSRQVAIEKRRARRFGGGREFDSLRDYRQGDERRDVSWTRLCASRQARDEGVSARAQPDGLAARRRRAVCCAHESSSRRCSTARRRRRSRWRRWRWRPAIGSGLLAYGRRLQHRVAPGARRRATCARSSKRWRSSAPMRLKPITARGRGVDSRCAEAALR